MTRLSAQPPSQPVMRLRAIEPEDLDLLYRIENDQDLWGVGYTNVPYSRYALHDYVAHASADIYVDRQVRLMIDVQGVGVVGIADMMEFDPRNNRAEVGIVIQKPFRHRGYAHQALALLLDYARKVLHLHQVYAIIASENEDSLNLFRHLRFHHKATLSDWLYDGKRYHDADLMQFFI